MRAGKPWGRLLFLTVLLGLGAGCTFLGAADATDSTDALRVEDAWVRAAPAGDHSAAYMIIRNQSAEDRFLVGAHSDAAASMELHQTSTDHGAVHMEHVHHLPVAAGETVRLEPGGYHLMLIDLQQDLSTGDSLRIVLEFDQGEPHEVEAEVR